MKRHKCKRHELIDCPYREEEVDYEHWVINAGESIEFAKERAILFCESIPCMYALELKK